MIAEPLVHLLKLAVTLSMAAQSFALFIDEAISRASTPEPPESHRGWGFEALGGHKEQRRALNRGAAFAGLRARPAGPGTG
jgi:hypothetical protein